MFRCGITKKLSAPREKMIRVVTEQRLRTYDNKGHISHGWEIAKEVGVTAEGYRVFLEQQAAALEKSGGG